MDLSTTTAPKSNQLNADDFIAGPKTFKVTRVAASGNDQQPVAIYFEGDNGKPYLPSKGMRRVLVAAWGKDSANYIGRQMTLFREPTVMYGGIQVGGIQISHLSHIQQDLSLVLTVSKQKRVPYKVLRLQHEEEAPASAPAAPAVAPERVNTILKTIKTMPHTALDSARQRAAQLLADREISAIDYKQILAAIEARATELTTTATEKP